MSLPKYITNEQTGIRYTLHGDYYLPNLILPESADNRPSANGDNFTSTTSKITANQHITPIL